VKNNDDECRKDAIWRVYNEYVRSELASQSFSKSSTAADLDDDDFDGHNLGSDSDYVLSDGSESEAS
jgi:hypothetical protein